MLLEAASPGTEEIARKSKEAANLPAGSFSQRFLLTVRVLQVFPYPTELAYLKNAALQFFAENNYICSNKHIAQQNTNKMPLIARENCPSKLALHKPKEIPAMHE